MSESTYAGDITETEAWRRLSEDPSAVLIDVRTPAEWAYVGIPDTRGLGKKVIFIPWLHFPTMELNAQFAEQLEQTGVAADQQLFFICRSGVRSKAAAQEMTRRGFSSCFNLLDGFEGNLDSHRHRGSIGGWKAAGLPWVQS